MRDAYVFTWNRFGGSYAGGAIMLLNSVRLANGQTPQSFVWLTQSKRPSWVVSNFLLNLMVMPTYTPRLLFTLVPYLSLPTGVRIVLAARRQRQREASPARRLRRAHRRLENDLPRRGLHHEADVGFRSGEGIHHGRHQPVDTDPGDLQPALLYLRLPAWHHPASRYPLGPLNEPHGVQSLGHIRHGAWIPQKQRRCGGP